MIGLVGFISSSYATSEPQYNQISLSAEATLEVNQDRMRVVLYTEGQNQNPAALAKQTTHTLNTALNTLKEHPQVKGQLGSRRSYPVYEDQGQNIRGWRERAELQLESYDFNALAQLTASLLLQNLNIDQFDFDVSDNARRQYEETLIKQAIALFRQRAQLATEALGGSGYKILNLNLNTHGDRPPIRALMMKAERPNNPSIPEIAAGTQTLTLTAEGSIEVLLP